MGPSFVRSTRFLRTDRAAHGPLLRVGVPVLAAAWVAWLAFGGVTLRAVSSQARLEIDRESHPVDAPVSGMVVATALQLDRAVREGEVLVELESVAERLSLESERAARDGLERRLQALRAELRAAERLSADENGAADVRLAEARAHGEEADAHAHLADADRDRSRQLLEGGALSAEEWDRTQSDSVRLRAAARAAALSVDRLSVDLRSRASERRMNQERLRHDVAEVEGDLRAARGRMAELEHEVAVRRIAATIGGRLGEIASLRAGQYVHQGERLAAIVPDGRVRIVAEFEPAESLGRVVPGAPARLRLHGFPWGQFGVVRARVESVGHEVRDERVRVELDIDGAPPARIPLQHGLPGTVEVDVETLSPLALLVRMAGRAAVGESGP